MMYMMCVCGDRICGVHILIAYIQYVGCMECTEFM